MENLEDADDPELHAADRGDVRAEPEAIPARAPGLGLSTGHSGQAYTYAYTNARRASCLLLTSLRDVSPSSSTRNQTRDVIGHRAECRATFYARAFRLYAPSRVLRGHHLPPPLKEAQGEDEDGHLQAASGTLEVIHGYSNVDRST